MTRTFAKDLKAWLIAAGLGLAGADASFAQHSNNGPLDIANVLGNLSAAADAQSSPLELQASQLWWQPHVTQNWRGQAQPYNLGLDDLLYLALCNSEQIKVYSEVPLIRETAVREACAAFDWTAFADARWDDTSDPVGSTLTIGGGGNRFNDHRVIANAGLRKRTITGGEFEVGQRIGFQDNNSNFFIPKDQATARLVLSFTQPLLRGGGTAYNRSLIALANIDVGTAQDEFSRQLQSHLLEVYRSYWALYLERATLAQRVKLFERTQSILQEIEARQGIDAQQSQLISARAALENRRADLIRAQTAVLNAETRMRALINAPELGINDQVEILPTDALAFNIVQPDLANEVATAIQYRPEVNASIKQIRAACIRQDMSKNEMLPQLNLITQMYVSGLQGSSNLGQAWLDQFSQGAPSYAIGGVYEIPLGNRAAKARLNRRQIELRQLQSQYRTTLETVKAEVDVAVRELYTAEGELSAKARALTAANAEAEAIEARWKMAVKDNNTTVLTLESLLRAQERITETEASLVTSQLTYQLAVANLRRANGTLLAVENIDVARICECGLPKTVLNKSGSAAPSGFYSEAVDAMPLEQPYQVLSEQEASVDSVLPPPVLRDQPPAINGN